MSFSVCVVRGNQYNPILYVVDIYLAVPIGQYESIKSQFIHNISKVIAPWEAKVKEVKGELDRNLFRKKRETSQATRYIWLHEVIH